MDNGFAEGLAAGLDSRNNGSNNGAFGADGGFFWQTSATLLGD